MVRVARRGTSRLPPKGAHDEAVAETLQLAARRPGREEERDHERLEYEAKVLDIDPEHLAQCIIDKGGTDLTGENTTKVYARHGIDLSTVRELRFDRR